jgi:hypothetical protein
VIQLGVFIDFLTGPDPVARAMMECWLKFWDEQPGGNAELERQTLNGMMNMLALCLQSEMEDPKAAPRRGTLKTWGPVQHCQYLIDNWKVRTSDFLALAVSLLGMDKLIELMQTAALHCAAPARDYNGPWMSFGQKKSPPALKTTKFATKVNERLLTVERDLRFDLEGMIGALKNTKQSLDEYVATYMAPLQHIVPVPVKTISFLIDFDKARSTTEANITVKLDRV